MTTDRFPPSLRVRALLALAPLATVLACRVSVDTNPPDAAPAASSTAAAESPAPVVIHPPFAVSFSCIYHPQGQLPALGDALGTDCLVISLDVTEGIGWSTTHRGDGRKNEDWYVWRQKVLAPFDGVVAEVHDNPVVNTPGMMQGGRAASILFVRADGVHVLMAHVQAVSVRRGDTVSAGQAVAEVGNNGFSRNPHIHIGAYRGEVAYPIAFDPAAPVGFLVNGQIWSGEE